MNTLFARLCLALACLLCVAVSACSSLLYMSHLAATGLTSEISDTNTTIERREEIAQGLENGTSVQLRLVNATWWLSLVAIVLIVVVALWGFQRRSADSENRRR